MFSCESISLLAALSAIDHKQHVWLAFKVGAPDESSGVDQDLPAAFVTNRISDTSAVHSSIAPVRVLFSMTREYQCDAKMQCNLISALGRI